MDFFPVTVAARRSLLTTFEELDDDQWEMRSLCEEWSMKEMPLSYRHRNHHLRTVPRPQFVV